MQTDFARTRDLFDLPEGVIYLDGNSLGPLPKGVAARLARTVTDEWGRMLITGWNRADWMEMPARVGDRIARLIGAEAGHVVMGDTLSIKVFQALASALEMRPDRRVILSDTGNFPSDLYMAEGLCRMLGQGYALRTVAPEAVEGAIDDSVAALMLTEVDYRTGRRHDMPRLTAKAHAAGALAVWDLAHSAGATDVKVAEGGADFAVGCTYKYLNSGPGGPAFIYVAPRHAERAVPALSGWLGHEAPFAFDLGLPPRARDRADARGHAAGAAARRARRRARCLGRGRDRRSARPLAGTDRRLHRRVEAACPDWRLPRRASTRCAAARSASATPRATRSCRR
jgi:kynureninase